MSGLREFVVAAGWGYATPNITRYATARIRRSGRKAQPTDMPDVGVVDRTTALAVLIDASSPVDPDAA